GPAVPRGPPRRQRGAGRVHLDAPALAARARRALRVDRDVPDLPRRTAHAAAQLAAEDDARRETGAEREEREVRAVATAQVGRAERGDVEVVVDPYRHPAELLGQRVGEREAASLDAEVDGVRHRAVVRVYEAGHADTDAVDVGGVDARAPQDLAHRARGARHDALRTAHRRQAQRLVHGAVRAQVRG